MGSRAAEPPTTARRRGWVAAAVATVAVGLSVVVPSLSGGSATPLATRPAEASDAAASLVSMINTSRANAGLNQLSVASDLTNLATERAQAMARAGALAHTANLGDRVCCWTWVGENVGYAYSARQAHDMFMGSADHRSNILHSPASDVGVAVVIRDGTLWVAEVFRARAGAERTSDADQASRDGDRSGSGSSTDTSSTSGGGSGSPAATDSGSSSPSAAPTFWSLADRFQLLNQRLHRRLEERGRPDPLQTALRYNRLAPRVTP